MKAIMFVVKKISPRSHIVAHLPILNAKYDVNGNPEINRIIWRYRNFSTNLLSPYDAS